MSPERREELRRTYLSLGVGELASAGVFTLAAPSVGNHLSGPGRWALWAAVVPLVVVLLQGGCYWLAARSWVGVSPMPPRLVSTYRAFAAINPVLFAAAGAAVVAWWPEDVLGRSVVVLAWLFGVAEYLNYYVVRWAYPARTWLRLVRQWRVPRLVADLRAHRSSDPRVP